VTRVSPPASQESSNQPQSVETYFYGTGFEAVANALRDFLLIGGVAGLALRRSQ
jgi:hypothetical protein